MMQAEEGEGEFASLSRAKGVLEPGGDQGPPEAGRDHPVQLGHGGAFTTGKSL